MNIFQQSLNKLFIDGLRTSGIITDIRRQMFKVLSRTVYRRMQLRKSRRNKSGFASGVLTLDAGGKFPNYIGGVGSL
jgi:hypothetical protein